MKLPPPDKFGNYWLGHHQSGPAIFPSKRVGAKGVVRREVYIVLVNSQVGFLMSQRGFREFPTVALALAALEAAL